MCSDGPCVAYSWLSSSSSWRRKCLQAVPHINSLCWLYFFLSFFFFPLKFFAKWVCSLRRWNLCAAEGLWLQHYRRPKLKSEPKSSVTEEGNPKPNPWLLAAATHISSGSNDSWYLKKREKKEKFFSFSRVIIDDKGALAIRRRSLLNAIMASSMAVWCHAVRPFLL